VHIKHAFIAGNHLELAAGTNHLHVGSLQKAGLPFCDETPISTRGGGGVTLPARGSAISATANHICYNY
jgi:hypothetical protein